MAERHKAQNSRSEGAWRSGVDNRGISTPHAHQQERPNVIPFMFGCSSRSLRFFSNNYLRIKEIIVTLQTES